MRQIVPPRVVYLPHALAQTQERRIPLRLVEQVVDEPEQLLETGHRKVAQSRYADHARGKEFLLRVFYEETEESRVVVSMYRTSKVAKYWRTS